MNQDLNFETYCHKIHVFIIKSIPYSRRSLWLYKLLLKNTKIKVYLVVQKNKDFVYPSLSSAHIFLWTFQSSTWHCLLQYHVRLHCPHRCTASTPHFSHFGGSSINCSSLFRSQVAINSAAEDWISSLDGSNHVFIAAFASWGYMDW